MSFVKRLAARKHLRALERADSVGSDQLADAEQKLIESGSAVLPDVFRLLENPTSRDAAARVASQLLTDQTLSTFVHALESGSTRLGNELVEVLSEARGYEVSAILDYLDLTGRPRAMLERVLQTRSGDVPARRLIELLSEGDRNNRKTYFRLLDQANDPGIASELYSLLSHSDWWVRVHALRLICELDSPDSTEKVVQCLEDENTNVRLEAVRVLGKMKRLDSIPALCEALRDSDLKVHSASIDALIAIGDPSAVPHLVFALKEVSEYTRRGAVEVLNEVATPAAIQDLVRALQDEDWWVRVRAADALGSLGGEKVVDAVLGLIESDDLFIRRYTVEILNSIPNEKSVEPLIRALGDEDWWVRERSIDALAGSGDERAIEPLVDLLTRDAKAAPLCARALGTIGHESAVDPLCAFVGQGNESFRTEVEQALKSLLGTELPGATRERIRKVLSSGGSSQSPRPDSAPGGIGGDFGDANPSRWELQFGEETPYEDASPSFAMSRQWEKEPPPTEAPSPPVSPGADSGPPSVGPGSVGDFDTRIRGESLAHSGHGAPPPSGANWPPVQVTYHDLPPDAVLLNRYRVIRKIGRGGFGSVYLVEDTAINDEIILKILNTEISRDQTVIRRFVHELKFNRKILHENVIRLFDFLELESEGHAISMEYFAGGDLGALLRKESCLEVSRGIELVRQICFGLSAAHDAGVIHRDIKPANILVGSGDRIKIVDFGLASMSENAQSRLTKSGVLLGTPHYMAPEQINGEPVDERTDVYSLGILMFEMFTGEQPYQNSNAVQILFQHLNDAIPSPLEIAPHLPPDLAAAICSAMAKKPSDRPQSIAALLGLLEQAAA